MFVIHIDIYIFFYVIQVLSYLMFTYKQGRRCLIYRDFK